MTEPDLIAAAREAREQAYAPYSGFAVGAALLAGDGRVFTGCNVENLSYGLTMCAERVVVGAAIASGVSDFLLLALSSDSIMPVVPCGACRQVLAEFAPNLRIVSSTLAQVSEEFDLGTLLPSPSQGILK